MISPTRVVLDEHTRTSDLTLLNRGVRPVRYRLSLVDMEMTEDGRILQLDTPPSSSALGVLRLSPREISLEPGVFQRIRIAAFLPQNQPDGELRSHLMFEPISIAAAQDAQAASDGQLRLNLEFRSVVTIPVIVRHGHVGATAALSDAVLVQDPKGWVARVMVHRTGNRSLHGNLTAVFVSADKKKKIEIGRINGLAVYCPNSDRITDIRLDKDPGMLGAGTVSIEFAEIDQARGSAQAKTEISVQG